MTGDALLLPELVAKAREVVAANVAAGRRVLVVESCTGGLVGAAISEVPGSSAMFDGGFITYANEAKTGFVGVGEDLLRPFGAVSVEVAAAMAQGGLARSRADVVVAITGVAGPGGGSADKPVGTVAFARAERGGDPERCFTRRRDFGDLGRAGVRLQAALFALELLMPRVLSP